MFSLSVKDAIYLVRKNFDEQGMDDSYMLGDKDSEEFDELVGRNLPEAINAVHMAAPVQLLDGEVLTTTELDALKIEGDVLTFGIEKEFLRLVGFQASDSHYVVTEVTDEFSTEGRMQHNIYTRGSAERPRLVLSQGHDGGFLYYFRYYTLDKSYANASDAVMRFEYIPRHHAIPDGYGASYDVAEALVEQVVDYLTGMMMQIYGNDSKANYFFNRTAFNPAPESQQA